ncbi:MAG: SusC/RagA family TonB-linked outer membrane protein [Saprospiraceae bacterium]|nr:SusC/RagA family TonB-linked outer membrane protein [Saprospiraceae bacterium]
MKYLFTKTRLVLLVGMLASSGLIAQFTINGSVKDTKGEGLIGATVLIKGTSIGTVTDIDGGFTLRAPGETATLLVSYTGFSDKEVSVSKSNPTVNVALEPAATQLEEIVITGLATSVKRSNSANAVSTISSKDLTGIAPPQTTDAALYGKFTGANIVANSGAPGGGIGVKLRGLTSIFGSNQPLFIVDGVYIDNSSTAAGLNIVSAAAGGGSQSNQDNPSNRLADLNPDDIETIEILKGASAAAIYGSRAAGGVVLITTKKGQSGKTQVKLSQSTGWTQMLNPLGVRQWDEAKILEYFGPTNGPGEVALYNDAKNKGQLHDYEKEIYGEKGILSNTNLSILGGSDKTKFYVGASYKNEDGIVKNTGYNKASVRLNVDQEISKWLDVSLTTNYINSSADRGFFNNDNTGTTIGIALTSTPTWAQLFPDANGNYPDNNYAASNPLQTRDLITNNEKVNRFIGGATATAKIYQTDKASLKLILRGGVDYYNLETKALFPRALQFFKSPASLRGVLAQGTASNLNNNISAFLVQSLFLDKLSFRTSVGVTQEDFRFDNIVGTSTNIVGSQTNLDQAANRNTDQDRRIQHDRGFFAQEEVNFDDIVIATVGIRGDKSSNNGDANKLYYYPKASLALNVHKFGLESDAFNQLKLRGAFGQSGGFARFGDKYTAFDVAVIDGNSASQINVQRGNPNVGPERQTEIEVGADIGILRNMLVLEATYYIKSVNDLLLRANVPTSTGYTRQVINAAELQNKGVELALNINAVNTRDFNWTHRMSFWKNTSEVTRLDIPAFNLGAFGAGLGTYRIEEGKSATQIVGTSSEGLKVIGNAEPDFQMSFLNSINYKGLEFSFLIHWKKGGENINLSTLLSDFGGTSHDYDEKSLDPSGQMGNGDYRISSFLNGDPRPFVENAGYVRLREVGLFYNIPRSVFGDVVGLKIGFSGTNLINFFDYNSYDPEVSNFGSGDLSTGVEVLPFPSSKRFNFLVSASF